MAQDQANFSGRGKATGGRGRVTPRCPFPRQPPATATLRRTVDAISICATRSRRSRWRRTAASGASTPPGWPFWRIRYPGIIGRSKAGTRRGYAPPARGAAPHPHIHHPPFRHPDTSSLDFGGPSRPFPTPSDRGASRVFALLPGAANRRWCSAEVMKWSSVYRGADFSAR